jgi:opacity protein-like surface antigen
LCLEANLKELRTFPKNFSSLTGSTLTAKALLAGLVLVCLATLSAFAQDASGGAMSPNQGESDGVTAGGQWMKFQSEDKMTGAKKVRFELLSNNYLREDPDYKPRVELVCTNGKYDHAHFNPGAKLGRPDYPGFWGQPKMEVMVRFDGSHDHKGWNWVAGRFLDMDKGTVRGAMASQVFNVEIKTRTGYAIAEFSPAGLNLDEVRKSCDLTPKKP